MSLSKVKEYLKQFGAEDDILIFDESSATVALAAKALGIEEARIAKTMSFLLSDGPILIVAAGDVKVDNKKFKSEFSEKAKMISYDDVEEYIGHAPGGVCPFAVKDGVRIYLDRSLMRFDTVFPAAGDAHSAIELTPKKLAQYARTDSWIDVCKSKLD